MTGRGQIEVRWGYSLDHLDALARLAGKRARPNLIYDPFERTALAWCGLVEHLYAVEQRPTSRELLLAGSLAIRQQSRADQSTHGYIHRDLTAGAYQSRRFWLYWFRHSTPSPEDGVIEREALTQIWVTLTPMQQEALTALAIFDDYDLAAAALQVNLKTFYNRVGRARHQFFLAWHEGETPARTRHDQRRPSGRHAKAQP